MRKNTDYVCSALPHHWTFIQHPQKTYFNWKKDQKWEHHCEMNEAQYFQVSRHWNWKYSFKYCPALHDNAEATDLIWTPEYMWL